MNFSDAEKNEKTIKIIKEMIKSEKVPGAFIFEGEDEKNKEIISEALAKSIVCENTEYKKKNGEGCGRCRSCLKAEKFVHPDIIVSKSDGEGNLSFHIDKARDITGGLYLAPNDSETKVYIVQNMQDMTPQAQNALLKSIEEPPPFAVFIITVNSADLILETVKSRAVKFTISSKNETEKKDPLLCDDIITDILAKNPDKLSTYQKLVSKASDKSGKTEIINFYNCLENALRDVLTAKILISRKNSNSGEFPFLYFTGQTANREDVLEKVKKLADIYSVNKILNLSKTVHKYKSDLDYNINIRLNLASFLSSINLQQ
jgi:DNA polymerase-3 subunit delta'